MKRIILVALTTWACTFVHAELKVHFTFESLNSEVGNHAGTLYNSAKLTEVSGLPILSLGGNNGYLDLGTSVGNIIATLSDYTISTNIYIPSTTTLGSNGNFIYTFANSTNIGGDANGCIFFGANETRHTICLTNYLAEKNVIANYRFPTGSWHTLTYRQNENRGELFLDGKQVATGSITIKPKDLGSTPYNFLGRPCYQGDVYLKDACYNDFRIYDNAVDDATIASLTANVNTLNSGINEMQINDLMELVTLDANTFYSDIDLPTPVQNDIAVTWSSSNESIVSSTGSVTRPAYGENDARVTLTATFSKGSISRQKSFVVYIPAQEMSDSDLVDADMMDLTINGHLDNLMTNLYLPTRGNRGSHISWESSRPDILSHEGELLSQGQKPIEITLTATISLRNAIATSTFYITIAKKLPLAYYLFAYFNGNSQWQEQICFALSTDGYNYTPLNNGDPIINSADIALKKAVRDPHILRGEDGYFYMVVTDMRSSQGWSSNDGMVLLRSADMVNWTHTAIDFPTRWPHRFDRDALTQVWAPQTIYDPEEGKYMVYYAIGESGKNYITYYSYANEDFTDLTEPQVLYNHDGMNTIDADIVWHDGMYHMFFKTEGQGNGIQKATSKTLRGDWKAEYKYLQQTTEAVEGSGVFKLIDTEEWILMYDCYTSGKYEYCSSTDLSNFTYKCNSANTSIFTPRHGTTIAITTEEAQRLATKWPSDGLEISASWTDITDFFVKSPRFDNNSSIGWIVESNAESQNKNFETMEFWNGTFNLYQTKEVPNGKYRLSVQSFYSSSNNESGYLYANEVRQALALRTSEGLSSNTYPGGWDRVTINGSRRYIPNNMEAGNSSFEQGLYNNSLEVEVTDGKLTFGLICEEKSLQANWCMFDNFKLEYLGYIDIVTAEEIKLSHSEVHLTEGENTTITATILPMDAVDKELKWTSSNPSVATVDANGTIRAINSGQATISAELTNGSGAKATCKVIVTTLGGTWLDVTEAYILNPGFDENSNKGWDIYANAGSSACGAGGMEFWNGTFNISQTFEVPNGKYRLSAQSYFRTSDNESTYNAHVNGYESITGYLYANQDMQPIASIYSEHLSTNYANNCWNKNGEYYPNGMTSGGYCFEQGMYNNIVITEVTDGKLTIGLINEVYVGNNWCMFDNFKLEYFGDYVPVTSISLSKSEITLNNDESATLKATVRPTNSTFQGVVWSSDNSMIAGVDQDGTITAHAVGSTIIRATSKDKGGLSASCKVTVNGTVVTAEGIIINEVQPSNIDMFVDPSFNYGSWIELYNSTNSPVSLNFLHVSDDPDNLTKYNLGIRGSIPAKGYHVLWFDHYNYHYSPSQVDFKLDFDGGAIYISTPDGTLITSQEYPVAVPRTSYARTTNGGNTWGYTASPTPGESNIGSTFATERLDAPVVDKDACLFTSAFTVKVQIPTGATLRYTTDGTTPTLTNGYTSTNGTFQVSATTTYRFGLFQEGKLPSQIVTRSYIYDRGYAQLPIISVVTDPVNLYSNELGVYVQGTNGRPGNGQSSPCNWNMDWDRPVNFEYITPDGGMVVNQEVDFAMCGGWSRAWTPHSFKLKAGKIYEGLNSMDYPFFADKPHLKHKTLQIRNGGNDTGCRIKDAALQEIVRRSGLDVEGQASQPVIHFINGEYKGMLNMREPNNKHYAYANWGIDTDEMDQFEMSPDSGYVQMEGDREAFLEWYELSKNAGDEYFYEEIRNIVDIDEYINYMAVEFYLGATDWPQNNIKGFRPRIENGRFRFVMFDLDGTFGTTDPFNVFEGKQIKQFDYNYSIGGHLTEEIELVTIFLNMLQNDSFRKQFIDTYCLVAGSVFEPERCNAIINEMAQQRAEALSYDGQSPYGTANSLISSLSNRQSTMINALANYKRMNLSSTPRQTVSISANVDDAVLRVNDLAIPTGKFSGTLFSPITLKAEPKAGYRFAGWASTGSVSTQSTTLIERGSEWYYYDQGSLDGQNWKSTSYSATSWNKGHAPLGYYTGDTNNGRGYNTILDYGNDDNNKRPTYYFRTSFNLSKAPTSEESFVLNYTIDDGMIVYVNGTEVTRYLMPNGTVSYDNYASNYANNNPDNGSITLDASLFKQGTNIIAIEVHNCDNKSSDIYLDAELIYHKNIQKEFISDDAEYVLPNGSNLALIAMYEPLTDSELEEMNQFPVRINEVSIDNSIYVNEYYKKNDWIELYNTTSEPIDVAGMYLTDNSKKPTKYQIPANDEVNTIIEPFGHLIIWADKLTPLSQLHASFKLDADKGGHVALTSADQSWSDILYYDIHLGTESIGLYPDGGSDVYLMTTPTIAKANIINSYAQWVEQSEDNNTGTDVESIDADPLTLSYREGTLHIYSTTGTKAAITLYDTTGRLCRHLVAELGAGYASINLTTLTQGTYIVCVTDSEGNTKTLKFVKK